MMKKPSAALAGVLASVCMGVVSSTLMGRQAAAPPAAPAQPASLQATLAYDLGTLSDKFIGLARVRAGKYDWRPAQGVRSVGEVFNLIVSENRMLIGLLSETPGQGGTRGGGRRKQPPITDPAEMQEAFAPRTRPCGKPSLPCPTRNSKRARGCSGDRRRSKGHC